MSGAPDADMVEVDVQDSSAPPSSGMSSGLKAFLSGGAGGMSLVFVGHPLDTIKVKLQLDTTNKYKGIADCAKQIISQGGVRGLYRGMLAPLVGVTPIFAIYFWGFEQGKSLMDSTWGAGTSKTTAGLMLAGGFSAIPGTMVVVPGERIKVLMQSGREGGPVGILKHVARTEGIARGLYKGTGLTLLRDIPGSMAYYGAYEIIKKSLTPAGKDISPGIIVLSGGMAGACNWIVATPADVLKSRFQTAEAGRYPGGLRQVFSELIQAEGPKALFKGLGPAMLRAVPANAACFLGMEYTKKLLNYLFP